MEKSIKKGRTGISGTAFSVVRMKGLETDRLLRNNVDLSMLFRTRGHFRGQFHAIFIITKSGGTAYAGRFRLVKRGMGGPLFKKQRAPRIRADDNIGAQLLRFLECFNAVRGTCSEIAVGVAAPVTFCVQKDLQRFYGRAF